MSCAKPDSQVKAYQVSIFGIGIDKNRWGTEQTAYGIFRVRRTKWRNMGDVGPNKAELCGCGVCPVDSPMEIPLPKNFSVFDYPNRK